MADRTTTSGGFGCRILPSSSYGYSYQPDIDIDIDIDVNVDVDIDIEVDVYRQDFSVQTGKCRKGSGRCHFCGAVGTIVDKFPRRGYKSCKSNRARTADIGPSLLKC